MNTGDPLEFRKTCLDLFAGSFEHSMLPVCGIRHTVIERKRQIR